MKCVECGSSEVKETRETLRDTRLGLSNIVLQNILVRRCEKCGEKEVVFPQIARLHRLIANKLIHKKTRLTGDEIRYLRKYLGWASSDLARRVGVAAETVSRWENSHEPIGAVPDRTLRLMVAVEKPVDKYTAEDLDAITPGEPEPTAMRVEVKEEGYELVG